MPRFFSSLTILSGVFCLLTPIAIGGSIPTPTSTSLSPKNLSDQPQATIPQANASATLAVGEPAGTPVESSSFNAEISDSACFNVFGTKLCPCRNKLYHGKIASYFRHLVNLI